MSPDKADLGVGEGIGNKRVGDFGRIAFALLIGVDSVRNLHHPCSVRRALEPARADSRPSTWIDHREAERPGVWRDAHAFEPVRRDLLPLVGVHSLDMREHGLARVRHQPETRRFDGLFTHVGTTRCRRLFVMRVPPLVQTECLMTAAA